MTTGHTFGTLRAWKMCIHELRLLPIPILIPANFLNVKSELLKFPFHSRKKADRRLHRNQSSVTTRHKGCNKFRRAFGPFSTCFHLNVDFQFDWKRSFTLDFELGVFVIFWCISLRCLAVLPLCWFWLIELILQTILTGGLIERILFYFGK